MLNLVTCWVMLAFLEQQAALDNKETHRHTVLAADRILGAIADNFSGRHSPSQKDRNDVTHPKARRSLSLPEISLCMEKIFFNCSTFGN